MFWLLTLRLNSAEAGIFSALGCWAATTLQQAARPGLRLLFSSPVLTRGQHQLELNVLTILTLRLNSAEAGWLGYFQPWAETGLLHALQQASEARLEALFVKLSYGGCLDKGTTSAGAECFDFLRWGWIQLRPGLRLFFSSWGCRKAGGCCV